MAEQMNLGSHIDEPSTYRIRVRGYLNANWLDSLWETKSVTVYSDDLKTETVIIGEVMDQAHLVGIINALYGKGYSVVDLEHVIPEEIPQPGE